MVKVGVGCVAAVCLATTLLWAHDRAARAGDRSASLPIPPWLTEPAAAVVLGTAKTVIRREGPSIQVVLSDLETLEGAFDGPQLVLHLTSGDGLDERAGRWRAVSLAQLPELRVGQSILVFVRDHGKDVTVLPVGRSPEVER